MSESVYFFLKLISPLAIPSCAAVGLIILESATDLLRRTKFLIALTAAIGSMVAAWRLARATAFFAPDGSAWMTEFARSFAYGDVALVGCWGIAAFLLISLILIEHQFQKSAVRTEIMALMLFTASGMMLLITANHLLMVFLALELMSLPTYVLVGVRRTEEQSAEAALRYFLFGSFASVLLVLGSAFLYLSLGTLSLPEISASLASHSTQILPMLGLVLLLVAVAFKVGIVPFHLWVPDAYEGAPTSITGFMGSAVKLTGFFLALRLFWDGLGGAFTIWEPIVLVLAVLTIFIGNIGAIAQDSLKRLFAYSSIAHAGYLFLALGSLKLGSEVKAHITFYLLSYGLGFLGLLGCISQVEKKNQGAQIHSLTGLGLSRPWFGICFSIFALSAAGIPPTAGFLAKYFILLDAFQAGHTWGVVAALVGSLIGVYYYLRILVFLYMKESHREQAPEESPRMLSWVVGILALLVLGLGFWPTMGI